MALQEAEWRLTDTKQVRGLVHERNQLARENERLRETVEIARQLHETVNTYFLGGCGQDTVIRAQSRLCNAIEAVAGK